MRMNGSLIGFVGIMVMFASSVSAIPTPWLHVEGNTIRDPGGNRVILRGVSLRSLATIDYKMVMDLVTNKNDKASNSPGWYTSIVRFPVYPENITDWIAYNQKTLKPAIDYATQKGLYAIIDLHYIKDTYSNTSKVSDFWKTIAPLYKDCPNVIFEPYNEPVNQSQSWSQFRPIMQAWVDTIRAKAPENLIFVSSPIWSQLMGGAATDPIKGKNIVYVVHMYANHWASNWNKTEVEKCVAVHPVVATEWGFQKGLNWGPNETCSGYGTGILTWMEKLGISWTAWLADDSWQPPMFRSGNPWTLRVGEGEMGGLVKDWLYKYMDTDLPGTTPLADGGISRAAAWRIAIRPEGTMLTVAAPSAVAVGELNVRLISLNGKTCFTGGSDNGVVRVFTGDFSPGAYIVEATAGGRSQLERIVIR